MGTDLAGVLIDWAVRQGCPEIEWPRWPAGSQVVLTETNPVVFAGRLGGALARGWRVWLGNSAWQEEEQKRQQDSIGAIGFWRNDSGWAEGAKVSDFSAARAGLTVLDTPPTPAVYISTSGTSGRPHWAIHTPDTILAAAESSIEWLGRNAGRTHVVLPLHHVSGAMAVVRGALAGGELSWGRWDAALAPGRTTPLCFPPHAAATISLVPTQLRRLLAAPAGSQWLRQFSCILTGGAALDEDTARLAREAGLAVAACYGATETAAFVTALRPEEFAAGMGGAGLPLSHARVFVRDVQGGHLPGGVVGRIGLSATSLCRGYWPATPDWNQDEWLTGDAGFIDPNGYLHITGRLDRTINTGGEKVDPERVESALLATGLVHEAGVCGIPDAVWGESVAAAVVPVSTSVTVTKIRAAIEQSLTRFQTPRHWRLLSALPSSTSGKLDRGRLPSLFQPPLAGSDIPNSQENG